MTAAAYDGTVQIVKTLLEYNADVNSQNGWALQTAAANGHIEIVDLLLNHGADVDAHTTHEGMPQGTALQAAVEASNEDIVDLLLQHGANPKLGAGELTCPVIAAAKKGEQEILDRLVKAKADVDVLGGPHRASALTYAAMSLPQSSICSLLDAGADINLADNDGDTALILASWFGDAEVVQCLLDRGADVLHRNKAGKNALQRALESDKSECVNILVAHISEIMEALRVAVESGNAAVTAVIRGVESGKQGLDYDELSIPTDWNMRGSQRDNIFKADEARNDVSVKYIPNQNLSAQRLREEHQASVGAVYYESDPTNLPQDETKVGRDATGMTNRKICDPKNVTRPDTFAVPGEGPQRVTSQPHSSWTQGTDIPPLSNGNQTVHPVSGPIKRKPINSLDAYGNVPPTANGPGFVSHQTGQAPHLTQAPRPDLQRIQQPMAIPIQPDTSSYQTSSQHHSRQPHASSARTPHSNSPNSTQGNLYHAYQPHQQQRRVASYGDHRDSSEQQAYQQSAQWSSHPRPYPSGIQAEFHRNSAANQPGQPGQRPQDQSSRPPFLGTKSPWSCDRQT